MRLPLVGVGLIVAQEAVACSYVELEGGINLALRIAL